MSQSRSEILCEFYDVVVSKMDLPELTFVNAVSSARVDCWDKLRAIEGNENLDSIIIDWKEEILFPFYESINDVLLPGGQSFLKTAPRIRDIVSFYKRILGSKYPAPLSHTMADISTVLTNVKAGDAVLFIVKGDYSKHEFAEVERYISDRFSRELPGIKILIFPWDFEIKVIREVDSAAE